MDISVKKHPIFYLLLYVAAFVLLVYFSFFFQWDFSSPDELRREINGPFRKWINGYLSILTNTKYSGPFCLLIIPSWIYLYKKKRLEACLFFVAAVFLIGMKGYINYRYAYTLFPLMLFVTGYVLAMEICDYPSNGFSSHLVLYRFRIVSQILPQAAIAGCT
jgi:hypothetical protein